MKIYTTPMKEYSLCCQRRDFQDALPSPLVTSQPELHRSSFYAQHESKLLIRLPTEIRLRIWRHVLDAQRIHIVYKYRRLGHTICDAEYWREWRAERPGLRASSWMYTYGSLPATKKLADQNLCDILVACRQIYIEAAPLLYTTATFTFWDLRTIEIFKRSILPERWEAVRSIEIYAMFYRKDDINDAIEARSQLQLETWPDACSALASLPNMRKLTVLIGNLRYLDSGYLLGGKRTCLEEAVLIFLARCKVKVAIDVVLASERLTTEFEQETWNLLGMQEKDRKSLGESLRDKRVECKVRCNLQNVISNISEHSRAECSVYLR